DSEKIIRPASMPYLAWATNERIVYKPDNDRLFAINATLTDNVELLVYRDEGNTSVNSYFRAGRIVRSILIGEPDYILVESSARKIEYSSSGVADASQYDFYRVNIHTGAAIPYHGA